MNKNQVSNKLEGMVKKLSQITGKKVSIAAHLFGNMNALNVLNKMSQADKDLYVRRFFALAPRIADRRRDADRPALRTRRPSAEARASSWQKPAGRFSFVGMGINFWMMKNSLSGFAGLFELSPALRPWLGLVTTGR